MHLQQTKRESAATGGAQYYFHNLADHVKTFLRKKKTVAVALVTPYGATKSHFFAVDKDTKLDGAGNILPGAVGHDRIQKGMADSSIGEEIRRWYNLPAGQFEKISIDIEVIDDNFYMRPTTVKFAAKSKSQFIATDDRPLTFSNKYVSQLWRNQIARKIKKNRSKVQWCVSEFDRVARDHVGATPVSHLQEQDLLRVSGALRLLGAELGAYVGKGYDCDSEFQFSEYPKYRAFVEIKKDSKGFTYQQKKYGREELSRAVILCARDSHPALNRNIDVIEVGAISKFIRDNYSE
jgi:hypothetical protein